MIPPDLPTALKAALDARLEGHPRVDLAARAATISKTYRDGGSSVAIRSETDALAYAAVRMPATYAALSATLNAVQEARPDFAPATLLDIGAGPGTASFAAAQAIPSLTSFTLVDSNPALRALALDLARDEPRFDGWRYEAAEARPALAKVDAADFVVASYVIGEMAETGRQSLVAAMWARTRDTLLIVEPGTPAGYARVLAGRDQLITAGAQVLAPCPHEAACALSPPDWCHFSQRLARSRAHKQIKRADVPFEDERFCYVALTRARIERRASRVLAPPATGKAGISAKLCTPDGLVIAQVPRRDREAHSRARHWRWGDAVEPTS